MSDSYDRMSPEFALVQALGTVPVLADPGGGDPKVAALQPRQNWKPPFIFYIPITDSEEEDLDGPTGLQSFAAQIHCVSASHRGLQLLCQRAKKAVREMTGAVYTTPEADPDAGPKGSVLIEAVSMEQSSPDLLETDVGLYRRMYNVRLDYQTESITAEENETEEVSAG